jgi:hypothetical protein
VTAIAQPGVHAASGIGVEQNQIDVADLGTPAGGREPAVVVSLPHRGDIRFQRSHCFNLPIAAAVPGKVVFTDLPRVARWSARCRACSPVRIRARTWQQRP